jgi:hypothetical protein
MTFTLNVEGNGRGTIAALAMTIVFGSCTTLNARSNRIPSSAQEQK